MKTKLLHLWDNLSSSYWFVPSAMVVLAGLLAMTSLWIDRHWTAPKTSDWIYTGGASGARALLSTVAGSVITVAGVVFSITIATLTQASSQFGPRLLRNFMRDLGNQIVLGTFVATFFYCLLVLRAVRGLEDASFVPNLSVTIGVVMAVGSLAVLIYFIHHISLALQGPQVVASVGLELQRAIGKVMPDLKEVGASCAPGIEPEDLSPTANTCEVLATDNGYLQAIDLDGLLALAVSNQCVIRLQCRPGEYLICGNPLLTLVGASHCEAVIRKELEALFYFGRQRTAEQDIEYSIRQLVEIAVRALSPGINDPYTAINSLDWLSAAICTVARDGLPSPYLCDADGSPRVVMRVPTFKSLTGIAFNQIRQFGADSVAVGLKLLETFEAIALQLNNDWQRDVIVAHADMVYRQCQQTIKEPNDLADVQRTYDAAIAKLRRTSAGLQ